MTDPTAEQTSQAAAVYKNIATLIRNGFFPGQHAEYVKDALSFLDQMASIAAGQPMTVPADSGIKVDDLAKTGDLHVVEDPK